MGGVTSTGATETTTRVIGDLTSTMVGEPIHTWTAPSILVTGAMDNSMEKVCILGERRLHTRELSISGSSKMTIWKDRALRRGQTGGLILGSGNMIRCTVMGLSSIKTGR